MPRTKQTKRSNPQAVLQLLPPLPSGRNIGDETNKTNEQFSINALVTKLTAFNAIEDRVKREEEVANALEAKKLHYIDWWSRYNDACLQEERFIGKAINEVEGCDYQLLDVYGDGNCLFYCLLLVHYYMD